jgi:ketosteroid isomerase-like protein
VLAAPVIDVWTLIGDLARVPEYSAGLERVEPVLDPRGRPVEYLCHFRPVMDGEPGIVDRNLVRWLEPRSGYASSGAPGNAFGLTDDLNLVTLDPSPVGTLVTWDEYVQAVDVGAIRASFDQALADIANRLVARFKGRVVERYARTAGAAAGPAAAVAALTDAMNRGDLDAAVASYEREAVLVGEAGMSARGTLPLRHALGEFIRLRPTLTTITSHVVEVSDLALYLGRWRLIGIGPNGAPLAMGGESADVLRRHSDDGWLIALDNPWGAAVLRNDPPTATNPPEKRRGR